MARRVERIFRLDGGGARGTQGERRRVLVPDALPQMRYASVATGKVVRATGVSAGAFPAGAVTIPANSEARILIDAGRVMAAFPTLVTSQGAGAQVSITYTEALYDPTARASTMATRSA